MNDFILPEYHMVAEGLMPPPSEYRWEELRAVTANIDRVVPVAVEKVYEAVGFNRMDNPKPKEWESAMEYVERALIIRWPKQSFDWDERQRQYFRGRVETAAISLVLDVAKQSTRYWGVDDPSEESYCSYCKGPKPVSEFTNSKFTCDPCFNSRRTTHTGGVDVQD